MMVKIISPLHSLAASGSISGGLTFRQTKSGSVLTRTPKPYQQTSPAQLANQQKMLDAHTAFLALSGADAADWQAIALTRKRSAWTCFFAEWHYQNIAPPNAPLIPEAGMYGIPVFPPIPPILPGVDWGNWTYHDSEPLRSGYALPPLARGAWPHHAGEPIRKGAAMLPFARGLLPSNGFAHRFKKL